MASCQLSCASYRPPPPRSASGVFRPPRSDARESIQCVEYVPTNLKTIIFSDGATAAGGWIKKLVGRRIIIELDSENDEPDGSCVDRVVPHGGVILFDETANLKPDFLQTCYNLLSREYGNIPIVLCSNKVNVNHVMMMGDKNITLPYFEISVNNDHNLEAPFLYLAEKLTENNELLSVKPQPPVLLTPPHIQGDMTAAQQGSESGPAAEQPVPVEDNNGCCSACLKPLVECLKACYYIISIADTLMDWIGAA
ncbi:GTP-binding nuclear protein Ran1B-like [Prunus yedoensis var. nudiflora]|uniref:GTP-binding nuclear protein Ran1B-like n=1 Tax=Prunus yedoensis var. nudiflora TaxID=2094558 RepID=A0A314Y3G3_PRUYE|nr:GTP-binding nuclear protein Ran1B-like [Prunus yedoensis var. nudiflora]